MNVEAELEGAAEDAGRMALWDQIQVVWEMSDLLCLFMVVMANMVVWVVLAVVRADIVMVVIVSQIDLHIDQASSEKIEQAHVAKANPCSCPISDSLPLTLHACYFLEQEFSANFSFCGGYMCTCF